MQGVRLDYTDFKEVTLGGVHVFDNRYFQNDTLTYAVDCDGNILGISIRESSLRDKGFSRIKRIEIGFGWVNAWVSKDEFMWDDLTELNNEVNEILEVVIGKDSTDYLIAECGYRTTIG